MVWIWKKKLTSLAVSWLTSVEHEGLEGLLFPFSELGKAPPFASGAELLASWSDPTTAPEMSQISL